MGAGCPTQRKSRFCQRQAIGFHRCRDRFNDCFNDCFSNCPNDSFNVCSFDRFLICFNDRSTDRFTECFNDRIAKYLNDCFKICFSERYHACFQVCFSKSFSECPNECSNNRCQDCVHNCQCFIERYSSIGRTCPIPPSKPQGKVRLQEILVFILAPYSRFRHHGLSRNQIPICDETLFRGHAPAQASSSRPTICSGRTIRSNCSSLNSPDLTAASRKVSCSRWASLAIFAAFS